MKNFKNWWCSEKHCLIFYNNLEFDHLNYNPHGRKPLMSSLREPTFDISHVAGQEGTLQVIVYMDEVWMKVLAELL